MTPTRALTTATAALCLTLGLAACGPGGAAEETTTPATPATTATPTTTEAAPVTNAPGQLPEDTIESFFEAADASAADGWKDTTYNDVFLTPELADVSNAEATENAKTGASIEGERALSEWTVLEESDTAAVVEFCNDTSGQEATSDEGDVQIEGGTGESVGRFTLTRENTDQPWLIAEKGYYPEGTSCADHFAQYDA